MENICKTDDLQKDTMGKPEEGPKILSCVVHASFVENSTENIRRIVKDQYVIGKPELSKISPLQPRWHTKTCECRGSAFSFEVMTVSAFVSSSASLFDHTYHLPFDLSCMIVLEGNAPLESTVQLRTSIDTLMCASLLYPSLCPCFFMATFGTKTEPFRHGCLQLTADTFLT